MNKESKEKILKDWNLSLKTISSHTNPIFGSFDELYRYLKIRNSKQGNPSRFQNEHPYKNQTGQHSKDFFPLRKYIDQQRGEAKAERTKEIVFLKRIKEYRKSLQN